MSAPPSALRLMTASQLSQLLVTSRKRHKLTQAEVGHRVGLSQNRISYLEKNADEISFGQLLRWCAVIGLALHLGERKGVASTDISEW